MVMRNMETILNLFPTTWRKTVNIANYMFDSACSSQESLVQLSFAAETFPQAGSLEGDWEQEDWLVELTMVLKSKRKVHFEDDSPPTCESQRLQLFDGFLKRRQQLKQMFSLEAHSSRAIVCTDPQRFPVAHGPEAEQLDQRPSEGYSISRPSQRERCRSEGSKMLTKVMALLQQTRELGSRIQRWKHCKTCGLRTSYTARAGYQGNTAQTADFTMVQAALHQLENDMKPTNLKPNKALVDMVIAMLENEGKIKSLKERQHILEDQQKTFPESLQEGDSGWKSGIFGGGCQRDDSNGEASLRGRDGEASGVDKTKSLGGGGYEDRPECGADSSTRDLSPPKA